MAKKLRLFFGALKLYWKTIFLIIYPIILLPIILSNNNLPSYRCLYVVLLMIGYWIIECLPLPITSLLPIVLFPLLGILDSDKTSFCYLKETNMMFIGGLIIAIAIEYCNLHTRIALNVIRLVGCSPRRLNFGLVTVTMLVSMWISNTAATAMMIPIIEATLKELETEGMGDMYEKPKIPHHNGDDNDDDDDGDVANKHNNNEIENRRPTKTTMCYFYSTACAANIGGLGTIVGSVTNLTFKGIYENRYQSSNGIEFIKWMLLNIPMMLIMMYLSLLWLQIWFMGLFRPKSTDSKRIRVSENSRRVTEKVIEEKLNALGPMTFHEITVGLMFILVVLLWFFRHPQFVVGWSDIIGQYFGLPPNFKIKDSTAAILIVVLLFVLPANLQFVNCLNSDKSQRPQHTTPALLNWKIVQQKLPWGVIILLGGGFALAEASNHTHMGDMIADYLNDLIKLPKFVIMLISVAFAAILTQFSSNIAVANILLPVLSSISKKTRIHPLYLMMPTAIACSLAFMFPISTPPNAIAAAPCNMRSNDMAKIGIVITIICVFVLIVMFPLLGGLIWDLDTFPDWAE